MVEHRQEFQRELEAIEGKVIELFAMVAEDLGGATHALLSGDNEVVKVLAERDLVIDALYAEIEELVNRDIALQACASCSPCCASCLSSNARTTLS
jgi:phosphate uptake regulator